MLVQYYMTIQPVVVEIFQSGSNGGPTDFVLEFCKSQFGKEVAVAHPN